MVSFPWFYQIHLLILWVGVAAILLLCSALGFGLGMKSRDRTTGAKLPEAPGYVASSILGLLALILGFTFSLAIARFETRRQLVIDESNAIGTTYLRAQLLRTPQKSHISDLLRQYLDARIDCYGAQSVDGRGESQCDEARKLQIRIWNAADQSMQKDRGAIESIFFQSLNSMIDLETERSIALGKPLPEVIYWVILLISAAGILSLEFGRGLRGEPGFGWSMLLVAVLTSVFVMIHDLERPKSGTIQITQVAMKSLRDRIAKR